LSGVIRSKAKTKTDLHSSFNDPRL
jgi:hypothetical protein